MTDLVPYSLSVALADHFDHDEQAESYMRTLRGTESITQWAMADALRIARRDLAKYDDALMREKMGGYAVAYDRSVATLYRYLKAGDLWCDWGERDLSVKFQFYLTPLMEGVQNERLWLTKATMTEKRLDPKHWVRVARKAGWTTRELQAWIRACMGKKSHGPKFELDARLWKQSINTHQEFRGVPDPLEPISFSAQGELYHCTFQELADVPDVEP